MTALLKISHLCKSFSQKQVLKEINLEVKKGEVIVILGPSGCGKSTLLRTINGLEKIDSGSILFKGNELNQPKTDWTKVRGEIGMVFQSYDLFPHMTLLDNILLGPIKVQKREKKEALKQIEQLLTRVGLLDRKDAYPRELSGGQKQRIAIVRALAMNPQIMLFDEVTASLDPEMVREVLETILELAASGMTMLIVTHELNFAHKVADKIIFMEDGEVLEMTDPKIFFTQPKSERAQQFLTVFDF